jgi:hypothetical protein
MEGFARMKYLRVWHWMKDPEHNWVYRDEVFPIKDGKVEIVLKSKDVVWNQVIHVEVEDEPS